MKTIPENLKQLLKSGKEVIFDNERTSIDDFRSAKCTFREERVNSWANGFVIEFNGSFFTFKTFSAFERKLEQLKLDWNLELKSW
jgi:hypothetical protein